MSLLETPKCPTCGAELTLEHTGKLDAWTCPAGHGLGFTLTEAYSRISEAEIHEIWAATATALDSARRCPLCSGPMVVVHAPTTTPGTSVALDVCVPDELFWFDAGELDSMPAATPERVTTEDDARVQQITKQFADAVDASWEQRDAAAFVDHVADVVAGRRPSTPVG
jgi:Zn-finger nucleic acid-binding protein